MFGYMPLLSEIKSEQKKRVLINIFEKYSILHKIKIDL